MKWYHKNNGISTSFDYDRITPNESHGTNMAAGELPNCAPQGQGSHHGIESANNNGNNNNNNGIYKKNRFLIFIIGVTCAIAPRRPLAPSPS